MKIVLARPLRACYAAPSMRASAQQSIQASRKANRQKQQSIQCFVVSFEFSAPRFAPLTENKTTLRWHLGAAKTLLAPLGAKRIKVQFKK